MTDTGITDGGLTSPSKAERLEHAKIAGVHGKKVFVVNSDGEQVSDVFNGYGLYAWYDDDTNFYAMYQNTSGAWIVIKIVDATGVTTYSTGSSDASTNWTNRASLTYQDYSSTF